MSNGSPWGNVSSGGVPVVVRSEILMEPRVQPPLSPIDNFLRELRSVVTAATPALVQADSRAAAMLVVRIVGGVESYIRSVLSRGCLVCPRARLASDEGQVTMFAARRYSDDFLALSLIEGASLADPGEIKKKTKSMLGFEIKGGSALDSALVEFGKACQVRHAVAHAAGLLSARNVRALQAVDADVPQQVAASVSAIQEISAACETVVREFNRYAMQKILEGWLSDNVLVGVWKDDRQFVKPIFRLFYSCEDGLAPKTAYGFWLRLVKIL